MKVGLRIEFSRNFEIFKLLMSTWLIIWGIMTLPDLSLTNNFANLNSMNNTTMADENATNVLNSAFGLILILSGIFIFMINAFRFYWVDKKSIQISKREHKLDKIVEARKRLLAKRESKDDSHMMTEMRT